MPAGLPVPEADARILARGFDLKQRADYGLDDDISALESAAAIAAAAAFLEAVERALAG